MSHNSSILTFLLVFFALQLNAQYPDHPYSQYPEEWTAQWISHPDIDQSAHALIHFRKELLIDAVPDEYLIHISGDNRYRLHINGVEVCYGPQLSNIRHWRYETIDISKYLSKGENIITAEVMNWGVDRSHGILSYRTGLLIQGHGPNEQAINTHINNDWKVYHNESIGKRMVNWRSGEVVGGFYAGNPMDFIDAQDYPWGWKEKEYDDNDWKDASEIFSQPKVTTGYGHGWILQPRTTKIQTIQKEIFPDMENIHRVIPPHSKESIVIDQGKVTIGYPKLELSEGKDAKITITYSEAVYDENNEKGHRNELENKEVKGVSDIYMMDGGDHRVFQPVWFRAFRFIKLEIETQEQALVIDDYHNIYSASEFELMASFEVDDPLFDDVWDICWHTMKICAQDNLMSDAYYEQMQYVGDLRPHLKAWTALTGDLTYFHSAIEQFNLSRLPDGNVTSVYPVNATFVIPPYSLVWIDMLHDLMMYEGDKSKIEIYTHEIQEVFDYYESLINENGLVGQSKHWMFIDWYTNPRGGNSKVNKNGNSAILTLNYAYTLQNAAEIMEWLGDSDKAQEYKKQGQKYAEIVKERCFVVEKGLYADDPEHTFYDQRASILAVLCGAHGVDETSMLMKKILSVQTPFDSRANLFYYLYLFEAMAHTSIGDFVEVMKPWKDIVDMGLTGTPEKRIEENPRSEVHPWTAHPVHYYFRYVAGINATTPGFQTVEIMPHPGDQKNVKAIYPTVLGKIEVDLHFDEMNVANGSISLPENMTGIFKWGNLTIRLNSGITKI